MPVAHISHTTAQQIMVQAHQAMMMQQRQEFDRVRQARQMQPAQMDSGLAMSQMNAAPLLAQYQPALGVAAMRKARAVIAAHKGDKLIERMAFWSAFGVIGAPIMSHLADKLERVTDEVEGFVRMAA